ncbi:CGNR zinc finger domain-containing protein [Nocardioides cavernaquae]|uniref:CGNR zinc finger domain-containing protein n=1 Tax=Nocardioides cavernaquae TaxID=2321396 RepID=A0A3A5H393_9ACTN|nr:CGNR zinc finger domain-containing protein [Nocardioides cavernaquae]RJS45249.1 CGNR zinc finger domain-containing protein [Nocardioides cavernaquae]
MAFAPETAGALEAAVTLANSALEPDSLNTVQALREFFEGNRYTGRPPSVRADLDDVRAIRLRLRELLAAERDEAVGLVNGILEECRVLPRVVRHDSLDWHLHAVDDDAPLSIRILVETAMAMIDVIRADEMDRLGVCNAAGCQGVILDLSRNRSRRYCSTTCGNRGAVAAYRARRRA